MSASRGQWIKLLALAGLVALLSVFVTPARADAVEAPIFHWNMKGGCTDSTHLTYPGACGSENRAYWLAWLLGASSWTPWTITLNEVCAPQFMRLAQLFGDRGYTATWSETNPDTGSACVKHGNAIFQLGTPSNRPVAGQQFSQQRPDEDDTRRIACRQVSTFGGWMEGCVTHLAHRSGQYGDTVTKFQDREAEWLMGNWYPNRATLGVDRNLTCRTQGQCGNGGYPWDPAYGAFNEVDDWFRPTYKAGAPADKLDWIYITQWGYAGRNDQFVSCNLRLNGTSGPYQSDHCALGGDLVV